jgi:SAM-dependent methyltransferase
LFWRLLAQFGRNRFLEWLDLSRGKTLLDVACRAGGPRGLAERADFRSTDATGPLPFSDASFNAITCIDAINHFSDRRCAIAEWARLLKPGGRLLFTDPITLTGPLTNAEVAVRSSSGIYLFVPHGYDECVIAQCGLQLQLCEDVTANMAKVAEARCAARASRSAALREIECDQVYNGQQEFLAVAARVASEGRLSRFVYVSKKLS